MRQTRATRYLFAIGILLLIGALGVGTVACGAVETTTGASAETAAAPAAIPADTEGTQADTGPGQFVAVLEGGIRGERDCGHPKVPPPGEEIDTNSPDFCSRTHGQMGRYEVQASDPRAGGTLELTALEWDLYPDGHTVFRGEWVLTNSGGTWVCDQFTGVHDTGDNLYVFIEAFGTGEYEGLVLYEQWHFTCDRASIQSPPEGFTVSGWIEEAQ